jgi:hypothetical protein
VPLRYGTHNFVTGTLVFVEFTTLEENVTTNVCSSCRRRKTGQP